MQVRAENLHMEFNDAGRIISVLNNVSLTVETGSSIAILGESGVGKTTLLHILGGLEAPSKGDVYLGDICLSDQMRAGKDVAAIRGKNIGFIFQFYHLLPEFDAVENVAMPLLIQGEDIAIAHKKAKSLLERVGLSHRMTHRPGMLSGGEQQRVAIARALVGEPGVVLADEPTGNLDQKTGGEVSNLLLQLQKEQNITLVVVTHSPDFANLMDSTCTLTATGIRT